MKLKIESIFVIPHTDIQDGDIIKILNEGEERTNRFDQNKTDIVFLVLTPHEEQKFLRMNNTSKNNMIRLFGEETKNWVNKDVLVEIRKTRLGDAIVLVSPSKNSTVEATK